jgi:hypothetical protein
LERKDYKKASHKHLAKIWQTNKVALCSDPKGTISLLAIGTWEEESFYAAGDERLVGLV